MTTERTPHDLEQQGQPAERQSHARKNGTPNKPMTGFYDLTRLLVVKRECEDFPLVIGAIPESTWDLIPPEEWDEIKRGWGEQWLGSDWASYEFVEVLITIPAETLAAMFAARHVTPTRHRMPTRVEPAP